MKFAVYSPGFGAFSDPRVLAGLAKDAEESGWDGYFLWDHMLFGGPVGAPMCDPWIALAAMAMATSRIWLGAMVTPVARRHPWKLARESVSLDILSGGRLVFGAGVGEDRFGREFSAFGDHEDNRVHAAMLDEGLHVVAGLWSGERFTFQGNYFQVDDVVFEPAPVQKPRIPVWVAATWPNKRPLLRAAQWDGVVAQSTTGALRPEDYRAIRAFVSEHRSSDRPFDVTRTALLPSGDTEYVRAKIAEYEDAGVTWWLVPIEDDMGTLDELRGQVRNGPPK